MKKRKFINVADPKNHIWLRNGVKISLKTDPENKQWQKVRDSVDEWSRNHNQKHRIKFGHKWKMSPAYITFSFPVGMSVPTMQKAIQIGIQQLRKILVVNAPEPTDDGSQETLEARMHYIEEMLETRLKGHLSAVQKGKGQAVEFDKWRRLLQSPPGRESNNVIIKRDQWIRSEIRENKKRGFSTEAACLEVQKELKKGFELGKHKIPYKLELSTIARIAKVKLPRKGH